MGAIGYFQDTSQPCQNKLIHHRAVILSLELTKISAGQKEESLGPPRQLVLCFVLQTQLPQGGADSR